MAAITPVFLDFETFWSVNHSLTKMNPIAYAMHPETELISLAYAFGDDKVHCIFGEDKIIQWAQQVDWSNKLVVAHNNEGFDSMICAWRLGVRPKMWGCTLAMARPIHAKTTGLSLAKLAEYYGAGVKDSTALVNTKGRHLKDFTSGEVAAMREYNKEDVELCRKLFKVLLKQTPKDEMRLIDQTIRMLVEPKFIVDRTLLTSTLHAEQERKQKVLVDVATMVGEYQPGMDDDQAAAAVTKVLASAQKFSKLLHDLGVTPPMKPSPSDPSKEVPALAKTDEGFIALQEHDDPIVAAAAMARLGVKSTILETRIQAFLDASGALGGKLPVPTKYYGADTTGRRSGWGYNPLNLPRVSGKPSDALRNCMKAPSGYKVVVADKSGIELRVNMFLWRVPYAMELFTADPESADLYKEMASEVFLKPVHEIVKAERQAGKAMHLGCGFGLGTPKKYVAAAKSLASYEVEEESAALQIAAYRRKHPEIVTGWKRCHRSLDSIVTGSDFQIDPWGFCWTCADGIRTPKGLIRYPDLRKESKEDGKTEWVYGQGRNKARIYAGKIDENIVQHLARTIITDDALEMKRRTGLNPVMEVYDELVYIVPEGDADSTLAVLLEVMRTPPVWWPELALWAEGDIADTYGAAK